MARIFAPVVNLRVGENSAVSSKRGTLSPRTVNFLPDKRGFIRSYRGKALDSNHIDINSANNYCGNMLVTNSVRFTDYLGRERFVIACANMVLEVVESETRTPHVRYIPIFQYPDTGSTKVADEHGTDVGAGGSFWYVYITFVVHGTDLIILNAGHPPLKWDGDEPVNYLGVRSVPPPPTVNGAHESRADGFVIQTLEENYLQNSRAWGTGHPVRPYGMYIDTGGAWTALPGTGNRVGTAFYYRMAYQNSRGQIGPYSGPTSGYIHPSFQPNRSNCPPLISWGRPIDTGVMGNDVRGGRTTGTLNTSNGTDIVGYVIARSTGVAVADNSATGGSKAVGPVTPGDMVSYQILATVEFTQNRFTDTKSDATLGNAIDENGYPPNNCGLGCSFKGYLILSGDRDNPTIVYYSQPGKMEAFPPINAYQARDEVVAVLSMSDRVCIVTKTTVEVVTIDANGFMSLLRKEESQGSKYGKSLVVSKDNVFGIWDKGYGAFNGFEFSGVPDSFGDLFSYIDEDKADRINAIVDSEGDYWCVVPHSQASNIVANEQWRTKNALLHYNTKTNSWFRVDDDIGCMIDNGGELFCGGPGGVYMFDAGDHPPESYLELARMSLEDEDPRSAVFYKTINEIYIYCGSTMGGPLDTADVEIYREENLVTPEFTASFCIVGEKDFLSHSSLDPIWDSVDWDDKDSAFVGPRFRWYSTDEFSASARFNSARIGLRVAAGTYAEIQSLVIDVEVEPPESPR